MGGWGEVLGPLHGLRALQKSGCSWYLGAADDV